MYALLLLAGILVVVFGPQLWVQRVLARHNGEQDHYPGTGGQLARHLLDRFGMPAVKVEPTDKGDHYDPEGKAVRLSPAYLDVRSLTAVVVAAHEVGHAIQDEAGYRPLRLRSRLVILAQGAEKAGSIILIAMPVVALLTRAPSAGLIFLLAGLASLGISTLVHLITIPVEWDASFGRALPVLAEGRYLSPQELNAAREILFACAVTYVAGSLANLLNIWRWLVILRR